MTSRTPSRQSSVEDESKPGPLTRLLFSRQSSKRRKPRASTSKGHVVEFEDHSESRDSDRSCERAASPGSGSTTPTRSRNKKFTGFASRSLRKSQWRLFKHRTFFGSRASTKTKNNNQLQLPRLTLRHPSVDGTAMPLAIDGDENEFLAIRSTQRRWTESESSGRLRDSRDSSSGYDGSHDPLDEQQAMTAPVSPCVPLSASSSQSEGWKYNSQRLLFKLKAHRLGYIAGFSHTSSTSSSTDSAWKSLDSQTWRHSLDDKEVTLRGAQLETICDAERHALQLIAMQRLAKTLPGISLKKETSLIRQKRQKFTKGSRTLTAGDVTRRPSGSSTDVLDEKRVFGVSLVDCMQNDRRLDMESRCRSLDDSAVCLSIPRSQRSSCGSKSVRSEPEIVTAVDESKRWLYPSTQNLYPSTSNPSSPSAIVGSAPPTCSLPVRESASSTSSQPSETTGRFIKKQRPSSASFSYSLDNAVTDDIDPHTLRVPRIVENCTQYLMAYGLNAVGLFRVAGNTKRCRQLRLALEKVGGGAAIGNDMVENTTPHDVATLLKEYFRDLPQSLLPKEHYQAYISASKIVSLEERIDCYRLLVALLSPPSVDTLFVLLKFLHEVAENAGDRSTKSGDKVAGNKMDAKNLATIFAPCILRPDHDKTAAILQENEMQVTTLETMITHVEELFKIPKDLQCKIYNKLRETEPMRLDRILDHIARIEGYVEHPLTSPFPATVEEDVTREKPAVEKHPNGKTKVSSQRSGSWPFSLRSPKPQRFFPNDETINPSTSSTVSAVDDTTVSASPTASSSKKEQLIVSTPSSARSPSRERDLRSAAAYARRRLRNVATVIRAFRFSSVTRSTPNMSNSNY